MKRVSAGGTLFIIAAFCAGLSTSCMEKQYELSMRHVPIRIGDATINVAIYEAEAPGLTYLTIHDNEDTAADAVQEVIRREGGRLIDVQHTGDRNVAFRLGDTTHVFDPNRIFTDAGAAASLESLGTYSEAAHRAVRAFADTLLQLLPVPGSPIVVTAHNNTKGEYSTFSYVEDGEYANDALFVHLANDRDPDNFFFVTTQDLYDEIRSSGYNVVMQNNDLVTDDGSLSVYVSRLGIPYVNVEAEHGHFEQQVQMLEYLNDLLSRPAE